MYRPVTMGIPAIEVYPITSGIASAASVAPAATSQGNLLFADRENSLQYRKTLQERNPDTQIVRLSSARGRRVGLYS